MLRYESHATKTFSFKRRREHETLTTLVGKPDFALNLDRRRDLLWHAHGHRDAARRRTADIRSVVIRIGAIGISVGTVIRSTIVSDDDLRRALAALWNAVRAQLAVAVALGDVREVLERFGGEGGEYDMPGALEEAIVGRSVGLLCL